VLSPEICANTKTVFFVSKVFAPTRPVSSFNVYLLRDLSDPAMRDFCKA
jgi:hypothetical protein